MEMLALLAAVASAPLCPLRQASPGAVLAAAMRMLLLCISYVFWLLLLFYFALCTYVAC